MPMSPKRSGFSELMMQYTYLPRLGPEEGAAGDEAEARDAVAGRPVATREGLTRAGARRVLGVGAALARALGFGFGMMLSAPRVPEHLANLPHQIFRQARLRDEAVAAGFFRVIGYARQRVAGHGQNGNRARALVGFQPARRFPSVHDGQRQIHQ